MMLVTIIKVSSPPPFCPQGHHNSACRNNNRQFITIINEFEIENKPAQCVLTTHSVGFQRQVTVIP